MGHTDGRIWDVEEVLRSFDSTVPPSLWADAVAHFSGGGLELGLSSFDAARRLQRKLQADGAHEFLIAFEAVVIGGHSALERFEAALRCLLWTPRDSTI